MKGYWIETREEAEAFVERYPFTRLRLKKCKGGWKACIEDSDLSPLPHSPMPKRQLQLTLARRYMADVFDEVASVNTRHALEMPGWASELRALPEIARPILVRDRHLDPVVAAIPGGDPSLTMKKGE